jgi:hypothetical protein
MNTNLIAFVAMAFWPLMSVFFFASQPVPKAAVLTIFGALLLLPADFAVKIPMIPAFDKNSVPAICASLGCLFVKQRKRLIRPHWGLVEVLISIYALSPLVTSELNNDIIEIGSRVFPGVDSYDGVSAVLSQLTYFLPFLVGRYFAQQAEDTVYLLRVLLIGGLLYSVPMLIEIRMSPQISNWIYGYFPSSFSTEARYGGFRPVVFFENGLALAFFTMTALVTSFVWWRAKLRTWRLPPQLVSLYLGVVLILCKSMGSLIYVFIAGPLIAWSRPQVCARVAVILVGVAIFYPLLRTEGIFPDRLLVNLAKSVNEERATSLQTRFEQEDQLLDRISERPIFGWGRYGRSRVYDDYGKDISLTDGLWIITMGQFGIVGYLALFGLVALPVVRASSALKFSQEGFERSSMAALTLIVALVLVEQLPNASLSSFDWLLAGSLLGRAEFLKVFSAGKVREKRKIVALTNNVAR